MHHLYKENKLSIRPLCHFELDPSSFFSLDSCFWTMYKESSVVSGKWYEILLSVVLFFISVKGSCINLIVAIISCPGVFSEQFMPPRGAKPQLESLMQISWLNVQPANMPFFFQCKAYHLTKCSPINIKKRIMKKGKLISWEVFSWLIHQIPPTNQPENV